ncbi:hypothetical protein [Streptosporangium vulgare]|uniref:hypothetical protein n=1 Tax=Streptosporangium vulgare TaxID=46190 RepID=UPI0031E32EDC
MDAAVARLAEVPDVIAACRANLDRRPGGPAAGRAVGLGQSRTRPAFPHRRRSPARSR